MKYPRDWPNQPAQEKGIDVALAIDFVRLAIQKRYDVGILVSRDTDLIPCLETVIELGLAHVEVAELARHQPPTTPRRQPPRVYHLTQTDYHAVHDPTDYS